MAELSYYDRLVSLDQHQRDWMDDNYPEEYRTILLEAAKENDRFFCESFLKIRDFTTSSIISFTFNDPQVLIHNEIQKARVEGRAPWYIILKARKEGVSTEVEGLAFARIVSHPNTRAYIVSHDVKSAGIIYNMTKLFYDELPEWLKKPLKRNRADCMEFAAPHRSAIYMDTAANAKVVRGDDLHCFHGSEVAFWPETMKVSPDNLMLAALNAIPNPESSLVVLESTANGRDGFFYEQWIKAKNNETGFIPIFLPWFIFDKYSRAITKGDMVDSLSKSDLETFTKEKFYEVFEEGLSVEEQALREAHLLSLEQLNWRRWTIKFKCSGDGDKFRQEHPANDSEAFISTEGTSIFSMATLDRINLEVSPVQAKGNLVISENPGPGSKRVEFVERTGGASLKVWEWPKREGTAHYLIGADAASGIGGGDFSCGQVLDRETFAQVAEFHARIEPYVFAEELYKLAIMYNHAFLAVENDAYGQATLTALVNVHQYGYLYRTIREEKGRRQRTDKLGWTTSAQTKIQMIDTLYRFLEDDLVTINSPELIDELRSFKVLDAEPSRSKQLGDSRAWKSYGAPRGSYDDRVMAMAIACQVHTHTPFARSSQSINVTWRAKMEERGYAKSQVRGM